MGPGTKDGHVTPPACRDAMTRKANPVVVGGVVRGTWAVKKDREGEVAVTWLDGTPRPGRALEEEVQRLAAIRGEELRLAGRP